MSQDPQDETPRNQLPEERGDKSGRGFPLLAPAILLGVALIFMLVFWLPQ